MTLSRWSSNMELLVATLKKFIKWKSLIPKNMTISCPMQAMKMTIGLDITPLDQPLNSFSKKLEDFYNLLETYWPILPFRKNYLMTFRANIWITWMIFPFGSVLCNIMMVYREQKSSMWCGTITNIWPRKLTMFKLIWNLFSTQSMSKIRLKSVSLVFAIGTPLLVTARSSKTTI